jgi:hypothetical protein
MSCHDKPRILLQIVLAKRAVSALLLTGGFYIRILLRQETSSAAFEQGPSGEDKDVGLVIKVCLTFASFAGDAAAMFGRHILCAEYDLPDYDDTGVVPPPQAS